MGIKVSKIQFEIKYHNIVLDVLSQQSNFINIWLANKAEKL